MSKMIRRLSLSMAWLLIVGMGIGVAGHTAQANENQLDSDTTRAISGVITLAEGVDPDLMHQVRVEAVLDGAETAAVAPVTVTNQSDILRAFEPRTGDTETASESFAAGEILAAPVLGAYQIEGLAPGAYLINVFVDGVSASELAGAQYTAADGAVALVDVHTHSASDVNVLLAPGVNLNEQHQRDLTAQQTPEVAPRNAGLPGAISGKVTVPQGISLDDIYVNAYRNGLDTGPGSYGSAMVDPKNGSYTISGLAAGTFNVSFYHAQDRTIVMQYWKGVNGPVDATPVTVEQGTVTGINANLTVGGSISGKVTVPAGESLQGVRVEIGGGASYYGAEVDPTTGEYLIQGLPHGKYKVLFSPQRGSSLTYEYWDNAASEAAAKPITVGAQAVTGINASLEKGATISGKITVPAGTDMSKIWVSASDDEAASYYSGVVDAQTGTYTIVGLRPGAYRVSFGGNGEVNVIHQYWKNTQNFDAATLVQVNKSDISGIDANLQKGFTISGTVRVPNGFAVANSQVIASTDLSLGNGISRPTWTDENGKYTITGLPAGEYRVTFSPAYGVNLVTQFWKNAADFSTASKIAITNQNVQNIDASLAVGATIRATVTSNGKPVSDASTIAVYSADGRMMNTSSSAANGVITIIGLPTSRIMLELSERHGSTVTRQYLQKDGVTEWSVTAGKTLDLALTAQPTTASITGKITAKGTAPQGITPTAMLYQKIGTSNRIVSFIGADKNGIYTFPNLVAGTYQVAFSAAACLDTQERATCAGDFAGVPTTWWNGQQSPSTAQNIVLKAGERKTGINGIVDFTPTGTPDLSVLPKSSRISGDDRFATAVAISKSEFAAKSVDTVVLATGYGFADALSAAPLAAKLGGPLLLTQSDKLTGVTQAELKRLAPKKVIIVGGTPSVGKAVETKLKSLGYQVQRLSGADRFLTSIKIAEHGWAKSGSDAAFVATGMNFPDALSAGAAAAGADMPVLLVNGGANSLGSAQTSLLKKLGVKKSYIAGSVATVSSGIQAQLQKQKITVDRFAGQDRIQTSTLIAAEFGTRNRPVYIAQGWNYPDALAGAAVAGAQDGVMVLSQQQCLSPALGSAMVQLSPSAVRLLGGTPSLSQNVANYQYC